MALGQLASGQMDSLRAYYQKSLAAYKVQDFPEFLRYTIMANNIRPNHPAIAYNLSAAYAVNGEKDKAVAALQDYLRMNATLDYQKDTDFEGLANYEPFLQLETYVAGLSEVIQSSSVAFTIPQQQDHVESIAYSESEDAFYLGSVNTRQILQYKNGEASRLIAGHDLLYSVMGLDVDQNNVLWVCSMALPEMDGFSDTLKNTSSILGIDLATSKVLFSYQVPGALLGDLIVMESGQILASDGLENKIYELTPDGYSLFTDLSASVLNLQGIAAAAGKLYFSDYLTGLYELDIPSGDYRKIPSNRLFSEKGTDGVLIYKGQLIAFQNGTYPKRTVALTLEKGEIRKANLIDQNTHSNGEPTQGVIVGNTLYFIANSAWHAYEQGSYRGEKAGDLEIRKLDLAK